MTMALPGYAPSNDQELVRSFHERIRAIETSSTIRVGPWVLSSDGDGNLRAQRPGQAITIDEAGATAEVAPVSVPLAGASEADGEDGGGVDSESIFAELYTALTGALNPVNALQALANFFRIELGGLIPSFRLPLLPLSHIRNINPNLLTDGGFDYEASLLGFDDWDYDDIDGKAKAGCAYTVADGNTHILHSNPIEADPGDRFNVEVYTRWLSLTSTAGSIRLAMSAYDADKTLISTTVLDSTQGTGTVAGWATKLTGNNWAPPAGTDYVVMELQVTTGATAGVVKFDDAAVRKVGVFPQSFVSGLVGALQSAADNLQGLVNAVGGKAGAFLADVIERLKNLNPAGIFDAIGIGNIGSLPAIDLHQVIDLPDLMGDLGDNIADVFDDVRDGWNRMWSGFFRQPGSTGKTAADVETIMTSVSTDIILAQDSTITLANLANAPRNVPLWISPNPFEDVAYPRSEIEPRITYTLSGRTQNNTAATGIHNHPLGTAASVDAADNLPVFTIPDGTMYATTVSCTYNRIYNEVGFISDGGAVPPTAVYLALYQIDTSTGQRTKVYDFGNVRTQLVTGALDLYDQRFTMTSDFVAAAGDHYELAVLPIGGTLNVVGKRRKGIVTQTTFYPIASTEFRAGQSALPASYQSSDLNHTSPYRMFGAMSQALAGTDTSPITLNETFNYGNTTNWQSASWNRFGYNLQIVDGSEVRCYLASAPNGVYQANRLAKTTMHQDDHRATIRTNGGWSNNASSNGAQCRVLVRCRNTGAEGVALLVDGNANDVRLRIATISGLNNGDPAPVVRATAPAMVTIDGVTPDDWTLEAVGNVYTAYHNGDPVPGCTWTDSTGIVGINKNYRSVGFGTDELFYNFGIDKAWPNYIDNFSAVDQAAA
jgi:hypothetical protein